MGQQLSTKEMAAYYAGRKCAASGQRPGVKTVGSTPAEQRAFALGYQHLCDEEDSRRFLAACRRTRRAPVLDPHRPSLGA